MHSPLKAAALRYAAKGWAVFILGRNKRPMANCTACRDSDPKTHDPQGCRCLTCHGFYAATREPKTITRMLAIEPSGMLAIRTGAPSGLVVVDVDPGNGGMESLDRLTAHGLAPRTRYVVTGSRGLHLYYQHPGPHTKIANSAGLLGPGIDIRGDGGYVAAPPSLHPRTREPYRWADEKAVIEEMAPALRAALINTVVRPAHAATPAVTPELRSAGAISYPDRLLKVLLDKVSQSPPGRRRTTLYGSSRGVARMAASGAISPADGQAALLEVGLAVGQTERSARAAIAGGFRDEGVNL